MATPEKNLDMILPVALIRLSKSMKTNYFIALNILSKWTNSCDIRKTILYAESEKKHSSHNILL